MNATEWAAWVAAVGAVVAAVASVAILVRDRAAVAWEVRQPDKGRWRVVNVGGKPAKSVRIRIGSAANGQDVDEEANAESVGVSEGVPILVAPTMDSAKDFAVNVTWRGRFGREERWTHHIL